MTNMFEPDYIKMSTPINRYYKWSFIGSLKQDRQEMVTKFKTIQPNIYSNELQASDMREIYRKSIFVLNGRGNVRLDCFRLYEASACGAIPIVVGCKKEIKETFKHMQCKYWLYFENWDEALSRCQKILQDKKELEMRSVGVTQWWVDIINKINNQLIFGL